MEKHVDLLGLLYVAWGAFGVLIALVMLALSVLATAIIESAAQGDVGIVAGVTAATLAILGLLMLVWGVANAWTGLAARRHRPWARALGLLLAVINLPCLPFGTALGIYAVWVLLNDETRGLFEAARVA